METDQRNEGRGSETWQRRQTNSKASFCCFWVANSVPETAPRTPGGGRTRSSCQCSDERADQTQPPLHPELMSWCQVNPQAGQTHLGRECHPPLRVWNSGRDELEPAGCRSSGGDGDAPVHTDNWEHGISNRYNFNGTKKYRTSYHRVIPSQTLVILILQNLLILYQEKSGHF